MKIYRLFWLLIVGTVVGFSTGCDTAGVNDGSGIVTIKGQVLNKQTKQAVESAFVHIQPLNLLVETNEKGRFAQEVEVDSTITLTVEAQKEGYETASAEVLAVGGRKVEVPALQLTQVLETPRTSGKASTIQLLEQSVDNIGVKESGAPEVVRLTFQVADSMGRPVVLDNAAEVAFRLGAHPGGREFLHPSTASTDNNGRATVQLTSGTKAGTVQLIAETEVGDRTIRSKPVAVAIHGGLPDKAHLSVGPRVRNFPGLRRYGLTNKIRVIVGDQYGNPVRPGTAVYFSTNYGVVEGSVLTDKQGSGSVELLSAEPAPDDGIVLVSARTADKNGQMVEKKTPVVFSGAPQVEITPAKVVLGQWYDMKVTDQNGNPLVKGTTVTVTVEGTKVKAVGHTSVSLDDTEFVGGNTYEHLVRGEGITQFSFKAVADESTDEEGSPVVESITVEVKGENGNLTVVLGEGSSPQTTTKGARVNQLSSGGVRVEAPKK